MKPQILVLLVLTPLSASQGQTTVTTTGGTNNTVAKFSGSSTIVNSHITDASDGTTTFSPTGKGSGFDVFEQGDNNCGYVSGLVATKCFATELYSYSDAGNHGDHTNIPHCSNASQCEQHYAIGVQATPVGSGDGHGGFGVDSGMGISIQKQGWATNPNTTEGEINGLNVVARQGPTSSGAEEDVSAMTMDVVNTAAGASFGFESHTQLFAQGGSSAIRDIVIKGGQIDNFNTIGPSMNYVGYSANSQAGVNDSGFQVISSGGTWTNEFDGVIPAGGGTYKPNFRIDGNGQIILYSINGGTTPTKTVRVDTAGFTIVNDAGTQEILALDDLGDLTVHSKLIPVALGTSGSTTLCRNASSQISTCSSSIRYKEAVKSLSIGMNVIEQLRPISFLWKDGGNGGRRDLGLVAEEVNRVEPDLVTYDDKGAVEGVKYDRLTVLLINAAKEQQNIIDKQQKRLDTLSKLVCADHPNADVCKQVQ